MLHEYIVHEYFVEEAAYQIPLVIVFIGSARHQFFLRMGCANIRCEQRVETYFEALISTSSTNWVSTG